MARVKELEQFLDRMDKLLEITVNKLSKDSKELQDHEADAASFMLRYNELMVSAQPECACAFHV